MLLVLDGFEGAPYKRVHIVQLYEGVPYIIMRRGEVVNTSDFDSDIFASSNLAAVAMARLHSGLLRLSCKQDTLGSNPRRASIKIGCDPNERSI